MKIRRNKPRAVIPLRRKRVKANRRSVPFRTAFSQVTELICGVLIALGCLQRFCLPIDEGGVGASGSSDLHPERSHSEKVADALHVTHVS
jgi:hypothetical protein